MASVPLASLRPADILAVSDTNLSARLIELGESFIGLPTYSHIAMVHHTDSAGTLWVIEGRPGGVGWRAASDYLRMSGTISNAGQPIPDSIRAEICNTMRGLLGTPYDWDAIFQDAARDLRFPSLWSEKWGPNEVPPTHVVCSSLAAYLYDRWSLPAPMPTNAPHVEPGDWVQFIERRAWVREPPRG